MRRLFFVACVTGGLAAAIFLLIALLNRQPVKIFLAFLSVGASTILYYIGHRFFDFAGLAASFPAGGEESEIAGELKEEVESLLREIDNPDTDWMTRHELRKRLAVLVQEEPLLLDLYGSEISSAHPFYAGKPLKNGR